MKPVTIEVYVLNEDSTYEGDFNHKTTLFADQKEAIAAYHKAVADAEDACTINGVKALDLTGVDPDDYNNYDGAYVKEDTSSGTDEDPNYCTLLYKMGEYADDHIEISINKHPLVIKGGVHAGLTKENIHDKI